MDVDGIVALVTIPAMVVLVFWIIFSTVRRFRTVRLVAELHAKFLERFATSQELLAYMQTEEGKRFLESTTVEQSNPIGRILGAVQAGVILTLVGLALMLLRGRISGGEDAFLGFGAVILALGVGFLISAGASYAISKSVGLLRTGAQVRP